MYRLHRPSRLFWFLLGAGSATLLIKRSERCYDSRYWGHCVRAPIQPPPKNHTAELQDVLADLSEATLDSVILTIQSLKAVIIIWQYNFHS